jgi:hypothetical protein
LYFKELEGRKSEVKHTHRETFKWIFEPSESVDSDIRQHTHNFKTWLLSNESAENVFWVFGKPGAGKSTLMKFIAHYPDLNTNLEQWSNGRQLIVAQYYFWRSGSAIQRSLKGVSRSLVFQILQRRPDFIDAAFPQKDWEDCGPEFEFPQHTLLKGLAETIRQAEMHEVRLFFLIDGLDEFDDRGHADEDEVPGIEDLLDFLHTLRNSASVKVCVSSRPLDNFLAEMDRDRERCFYLHDLTRKDIEEYIETSVGENEQFRRYASSDREYAELVEEIIDAANGVFLWAHLACRTLLQGIKSFDSVGILRQRLRELPRKLNALYEHILGTIEPVYRKHTARALLLASATYGDGELHTLAYLALDESFCAEQLWKSCKTVGRIEQLQKRASRTIFAWCGSLLEEHDRHTPSHWESKKGKNGEYSVLYNLCKFTDHTLEFTHRTVAEFLKSASTHRRLLTDAGSEPVPEVAECQYYLAALSLFSYELNDGENSGFSDSNMDICPEWRKTMIGLIRMFVAWSERIDHAAACGLWSETKKIVCLHSQSDNYPLIELMFQSNQFSALELNFDLKVPGTLTPLAVAISYAAQTFTRCELQVVSVRGLSSGVCVPPLYLAVCREHRGWTECISILLDHGANPNEPFKSRTPWKLFLGRICQRCVNYSSCVAGQEPGLSSALNQLQTVCSLFIDNGADLDISCSTTALLFHEDRRVKFVPTLPPPSEKPQEQIHLTFSARAVLRNIGLPTGTNASADPGRSNDETPSEAHKRLLATIPVKNSTSDG